MAKYDITYSCGHTVEKQLYGKTDDRYSYIEWAQKGLCPTCWGEKKRAEEATKPIEMIIQTNGMDTDVDGNYTFEIILTGGTIHKKEEIKKLGYSFGETRGGIFDLLGTSRPPLAWSKRISLINPEEIKKEMAKLDKEAKQLEAKIKVNMSVLDEQMLVKNMRQKIEKDKEIAKVEKPQRPACHPRAKFLDGKWNGKYYGNEKYNNISYYVDNVQYFLTNEEYKECINYREKYHEYKEKVEKIKNRKEAQ